MNMVDTVNKSAKFGSMPAPNFYEFVIFLLIVYHFVTRNPMKLNLSSMHQNNGASSLFKYELWHFIES